MERLWGGEKKVTQFYSQLHKRIWATLHTDMTELYFQNQSNTNQIFEFTSKDVIASYSIHNSTYLLRKYLLNVNYVLGIELYVPYLETEGEYGHLKSSRWRPGMLLKTYNGQNSPHHKELSGSMCQWYQS